MKPYIDLFLDPLRSPLVVATLFVHNEIMVNNLSETILIKSSWLNNVIKGGMIYVPLTGSDRCTEESVPPFEAIYTSKMEIELRFNTSNGLVG